MNQSVKIVMALLVVVTLIVGCTPPDKPPLERSASVTGTPIADGSENRMLVQVKGQGSSRSIAEEAAREVAAIECFKDAYGREAMNKATGMSGWKGQVSSNTEWDGNARYTAADTTRWASGSTYVEGRVRVMVEPLREWLEDNGIGTDPGDPFGTGETPPPSICVVYTTDAGKYLTEDDIDPFQSMSQTIIMETLEERGVDVKIYTKELAAVRSVIGNASGDYGINENYCIPADVFVEYRILYENRPRGYRKYQCNIQAVSNSTAEAWGTAVGYSEDVNAEGEGIRQCCMTAIDNVWADIMEEYRKQRERGFMFRVVCQIGDSMNEDVGDIMYDALDDICNNVRFISQDANRLEMEAWAPLDLDDSNRVYRAMRDYGDGKGVKVRVLHLFRQIAIVNCE